MEAGVSYNKLMTIPAVGPITALTWALEVGDVQRFSSIKKAISYYGLCGAEKRSGNTVQLTPLSKQRNKHLQTTLELECAVRSTCARVPRQKCPRSSAPAENGNLSVPLLA
jgi:transposase